ncbi:MAG TPA: sn-glycerol-1-phosphate dehydrogenase [Candidatus Blautia stercoravium]|nr:sn-glycerol-1-phosphate dehydrogenase [Candidatus Blautia stercoravium]
MEKTDWKAYLQKEIQCSCGRTHFCDIEEILIEDNAICRLPEILSRHSYKKLCVVCDEHTEKAAGFRVYEALAKAGFNFSKVLYHEPELVPDEQALIYLFTQVPQDCDLIIAVGSGTINDLCRYVSYKMKIDYYVVGTAPSMDGYASNVSPLIIRHLKTTYTARPARVIIGDLQVLCEAPMHMLAAGVGDIIGKYVCLADWQLAHEINEEYLCPEVTALVRTSIEKVTENAEAAAKREKNAVAALMEGLVLSGIAMSYIGNSRPASGSEHHMSHYWEMMFLLRHQPDPLHGTKVGVATVAALRLYEMLKEKKNGGISQQVPDFSYDKWAEEIEEAYGPAAPEVLKLEQEVGKNADNEVLRRRRVWEEKQEEIRSVLENLPSAKTIAQILKSMGAPSSPAEIEVSQETFKKGIYFAKDLRNRFGLLQILFDFNFQRTFSKILEEEFYR